ncbi:DoxX family protein [Smaragdicoccus niigatensis]|uniref:DoxX family protein n=2 Tax=Smaragdicoccus niigatensis TaxID=359359 RepID=UPI00037791E6|nr:DoxX family protein [Smaragdicoccus niigatensis]
MKGWPHEHRIVVVAGLLGVVFLMAGAMKLARSKAQLVENPNMAWAQDLSPELIKAIGAAEVAGAAGLILPAALQIATALVPLAAAGLALIMIGAIITHGRRAEYPSVVVNLALFSMALFVAVERFGPHAF